MIRFNLFLSLTLAACAAGPKPLPPSLESVPLVVAEPQPVATDVRPVVLHDRLHGRWAITAVNGTKTNGLWLDLGGEGLGTVSRSGSAVYVGSPQPPTRAYLGCNNWNPIGWTRNGDKLTLGTEMSTRTERGCDKGRMAVDDQAHAILSESMSMQLSPPTRMRLVNGNGFLDLVRAQAKPVFLKAVPTTGIPFPSIGRATVGRLLVSDQGCVYVQGVDNLLIIWPADAVYDEQGHAFRTAGSGELKFGMKLTFTGTPVQPLKVSKVGGVEVPAVCRRMLVLLVGEDGARRL